MESNTNRLMIVEHPPVGIPLQKWDVESEAEALQIVGNAPAYLFKSKIIEQLYLFIPVVKI